MSGMSTFKGHLRRAIGRVLEWHPRLRREVDEGLQTGRDLRAKRWMLEARIVRAARAGDAAAIAETQRLFWAGDTGTPFHDLYAARFDRWFHGPHQVLVRAALGWAADTGCRRLVEIGCDDGRALAHLAARLPGLEEGVGIDINAAIITRAGQMHAADARLSFREGDAVALGAGLAAPRAMLMSNGGVMEYIAPDGLAALFAAFAAHAPAAVALIEPVDPGHDLAADPGSYPFGVERSFSHNHRRLLEAAGFGIALAQDMTVDGVRWMLMLATTDGPKGRTRNAD
jgi:SAM-dependent methyltransferase